MFLCKIKQHLKLKKNTYCTTNYLFLKMEKKLKHIYRNKGKSNSKCPHFTTLYNNIKCVQICMIISVFQNIALNIQFNTVIMPNIWNNITLNSSTWLRKAITEAHEGVLVCHSAARQTPVGESVYKNKQGEIKLSDSLYQHPNGSIFQHLCNQALCLYCTCGIQ